MRAPPDIQVSSLLYYLGTALRQDSEIERLTGAAPEEIVSQTVEYKPMESGGGKIYLLGGVQLPCLALNIENERHRIVPGTHHGREFSANLWYLFRPFQSESADIHGYTKGQRLTTLIWWRIQYYLKHQQLPAEVPTDEATFDLQGVSKIRTVEMNGSSDRFEFEKVEGMRIPLTVWHGYAPYEAIDPPIMELISLGITSEAGSGVGVEADIDV